jgi:predicted AlkP superfamily pyrophosphatase or phosphodiesterase
MVVIISIDGLRPDSLSVARTPNILDMASRGTACWQAQTIFPPITLPSHASMLTGYPPSIHGLTWPDYRPEKGLSKVPTIFSYARATGLRTAMVVGKDKLNHLRLDGTLDDYEVVPGGDEPIVNAAIVQVQAGADLLMVHLPDVDTSGHASGWMSDAYLQQVAEADHAVGRLLAALPPQATIILTADHGGLGPTHGVDRVQDMTIPWIIEGGRRPQQRAGAEDLDHGHRRHRARRLRPAPGHGRLRQAGDRSVQGRHQRRAPGRRPAVSFQPAGLARVTRDALQAVLPGLSRPRVLPGRRPG